MSAQQPLDVLIGLARDAVDAATRELGSLQATRLQAERQLQMLEGYLEDYRVRLQQAICSGLSAAAWQNYQRFIGTLEGAIGEQRNVLRHAEGRLDDGRVSWQQETRKLNAFDTLAQRREQAQAQQALKREQRATDEFAAQQMRRRFQPETQS
ncbi:flagella biosynthesis chaperone FliJ [Achromobacter sp. GG226]|uniref:flagellar export protein FliJ n=1 Tax=Verticiella alkaliphila TaxID=2779529 RepID=UPI001C0C1428|nr:flagellar export protein FliJ [Verticiella sp. GG226]MBU4610488.1 flagella biosynthesis chaperone FliJ [Verticiella sp. GG226]